MDNATAQSKAGDAVSMTNEQKQPELSVPGFGAGGKILQDSGVARADSNVPGFTIAADTAPVESCAVQGGLGGDGSPPARTVLGELPVTGLPFGLQALPRPSAFSTVAGADTASNAACWVATKRARSPDQENQEPNKRQQLETEADQGDLPTQASAPGVLDSPVLNPLVESLLADLEDAINKQGPSSPAAAPLIHPARAALLTSAEVDVEVPWNLISTEEEELEITGANQQPLGFVKQEKGLEDFADTASDRKRPTRRSAKKHSQAAQQPVRTAPGPVAGPIRPVVLGDKSDANVQSVIFEFLKSRMGWFGRVTGIQEWAAVRDSVNRLVTDVQKFDKVYFPQRRPLPRAPQIAQACGPRDPTKGSFYTPREKSALPASGGVTIKNEATVEVTQQQPALSRPMAPAVPCGVRKSTASVFGPQTRRDSGIGGIATAEALRTMRSADDWPPVSSAIDSYHPPQTGLAPYGTASRASTAAATPGQLNRAAKASERVDSYRPMPAAPSHAAHQMSEIALRSGMQPSSDAGVTSHPSPVATSSGQGCPGFNPPTRPRANGLPLAEYARSYPSASGNHLSPYGYRRAPEATTAENSALRKAESVGDHPGYRLAFQSAAVEHGARQMPEPTRSRTQYRVADDAPHHVSTQPPNEQNARLMYESGFTFDRFPDTYPTTTTDDYEDYYRRVARFDAKRGYQRKEREERDYLDYK